MTTSLFLSPFGLVRASVTPRYDSPITAAAVTPPLGTLLMPGEPLSFGQVQVRAGGAGGRGCWQQGLGAAGSRDWGLLGGAGGARA